MIAQWFAYIIVLLYLPFSFSFSSSFSESEGNHSPKENMSWACTALMAPLEHGLSQFSQISSFPNVLCDYIPMFYVLNLVRLWWFNLTIDNTPGHLHVEEPGHYEFSHTLQFDSCNLMRNIVCPKRNAPARNSFCDFDQDAKARSFKNYSSYKLSPVCKVRILWRAGIWMQWREKVRIMQWAWWCGVDSPLTLITANQLWT